MSEARVIAAKITRVGMAALFAADSQGLALRLSHIALGAGGGTGYVPTGAETALRSEFVRVAIGGGETLAPDEILVQALIDGAAQGWINEIGVFDEDGVLFAVWSEVATPLAYKSAGVPLVVALTLAVAEIPSDRIEIVVGSPSVNITIAAPFADLAAQVVRLQRRVTQSECEKLAPTIGLSA